MAIKSATSKVPERRKVSAITRSSCIQLHAWCCFILMPAVLGATLLRVESWVERRRSANLEPAVEETEDSVCGTIGAMADEAIAGNWTKVR